MDIADRRRWIPAVRFVRWKDVQRQDDTHMTGVSTVVMTIKTATATALVRRFPAGDPADIMAVIGKKNRS